MPSPFSGESKFTTTIAFDYIGTMTLESSSRPQMYPAVFNMAVSQHLSADERKAIVEVFETPRIQSSPALLYGNHLAYKLSVIGPIIIVDWTALPKDSTSFSRVHVMASYPKHLVLLPNRRIFAVENCDRLSIGIGGEHGLTSSHSPTRGPRAMAMLPPLLVQRVPRNGRLLPNWGPGQITPIPVEADSPEDPIVGSLAKVDSLQPQGRTLNCYGYNKGVRGQSAWAEHTFSLLLA
ncbi:hypothetical protein BKA70DRAFT_1428804 [Coprinopsis sp. MPI-PUGE-AT-0042]|nr:hypothetical protein BKA70DRAFT_1428804 [Coprinopsis sp. MPI-PUGE-AT-0042]